jgi:hypothetical protein
MPQPGYEIPTEALRAGMTDPLAALLMGTSEYGAIAARTRELFDRGRQDALYVPAVKFILDSTLGTLEQPGVEPHLPREIADRSEQAMSVAENVTNFALEQGLLATYYGHNAFFSDLLSVANDLTEPGFMNELGAYVFPDVQVASGGALKVLQQRGIQATPAEVISRSDSLLLVAGIGRARGEEASEFIGWPYADPEHLEPIEGASGIEVAFTEEAQERLRRLRGRGCPAGEVPVPSDPLHSLLDQYWGRIVRYLVPDDATANRQA